MIRSVICRKGRKWGTIYCYLLSLVPWFDILTPVALRISIKSPKMSTYYRICKLFYLLKSTPSTSATSAQNQYHPDLLRAFYSRLNQKLRWSGCASTCPRLSKAAEIHWAMLAKLVAVDLPGINPCWYTDRNGFTYV